ncbi:hypothetical protein RHS04_06443 [Rhizoctonia solani]|uniref:AMP-dependent synthetase/ligase domain-containing protein n=1 Tax=Rhizoctonia solani TaxID=456999 RepID=A0A8H7H3Q6_9AGAM|nr:hypothetical protein RHS04_06443 [Rhizoctonia solani]
MSLNTSASAPKASPGPNADDPLTDDELALLLAVPRAAESSPNSTLFRLPLGPDPTMGSIDATCAEVCSIIARLAELWQSRLPELVSTRDQLCANTPLGPGITICILAKPLCGAIFHLLAFWSIGCTIQFVSVAMEPDIIDSQLNQSGCKVVVYSGFDEKWIDERRNHFRRVFIKLPEEEESSWLIRSEKQRPTLAPPPWPTPRRPTPALVLQSSGTTGKPKLLSYLRSKGSGSISKNPHTHPRLVLAPPYWPSFYRSLFVHLTTATPMALPYVKGVDSLSPSRIIGWATALDVGAIAASTGLIRQIPLTAWEAHADFFRSLFDFTISGSSIDYLAPVFERLKIPITNLYGTSELGRLLYSTEPPYSYLQPYKDAPPPLVLPISNYAPDGSRNVELWYSPRNSYHLAHYLIHGGIPLELEPFPGDGPHKGELAMNMGDVFREITIGCSSERAYIHVGRHSDQIRLGGAALGNMNAALYENRLRSEIDNRISQLGSSPWALDAIQLFGNNMQCTSLIIQLCPSSCAPKDGPDEALIQELHQSIEWLNEDLKLSQGKRVNVNKRTLIVTSDGAFAHGPGADSLMCSGLSLSTTHKRTPKRWENVCRFKPWLDDLDFSDP